MIESNIASLIPYRWDILVRLRDTTDITLRVMKVS